MTKLEEMLESLVGIINEGVSEEKMHKKIKIILDKIIKALKDNGMSIVGPTWKDSEDHELKGHTYAFFRTGTKMKKANVDDIINAVMPKLPGWKLKKRDKEGFVRIEKGHT